MAFALDVRTPPGARGIASCVRIAWLLAAVAAAAAGCASPLSRKHADLSPRTPAIGNAGLLPPAIAMYEEQYRFKLVPREEWSREATDAVRKAFVEEMAAAGLPVAAIDGEDREMGEIAGLYAAVDFSIGRHVYEDALKETFPGKVRAFDYSVGPAAETMERHRVDAVWIVTGANLLPTVGTRIADTVDVLMAIAGGLAKAPTFSYSLTKLEFRAALIDRNGTVLFHCKLNPADLRRAARGADGPAFAGSPGPAAQDEPGRDDIRDPRVARHYVRALISEYRKAAP